jgi:hemolysin D
MNANTPVIRPSASFLPVWKAKHGEPPGVSPAKPPGAASASPTPPSGAAASASPPAAAVPALPAKPPEAGTRAAAPSIRMRADDREFLPAALEIYETPPSPIAVSFIWVICAAFAAALAWAYFGWMDINAVASGKIQPSGRSKVVQPLEPGRVEAILVENGAKVEAGDVLLELDPTETAADRNAQRLELESAVAEAARRTAAIEAAKFNRTAIPIQFPDRIIRRIRQREEVALVADLAQLTASLNSLKAQADQTRAAIGRLTDSLAAREKVIALTKERADMRELVEKRGAGSRSQIIDALERYQTEVTTQVGEQGQLRESTAALTATEKKVAETISQFIADQTEKRLEAERKYDRLSQDLIKAESKNARTRLKAPVSGIVQQLAVTTVGQVVTSGQALMTIVPPDAPLEIEAMILNKDIGFVRVGQPAIVKVEAFPFTRYGVIDGTVTRISADAVDMRSAPNLSEADAAVRPQGSQSSASGRGPEMAFPATISLARRAMDLDGKPVNLSPGMTVTVEVQTGQRRIIDYVLSPLRETVSQAAHER